jgi:hypothetical protein
MPETNKPAVVYVSPDGQNEMPVRSPATQINLEARGWTRKDGKAPVSTSPTTDQAARQSKRDATDK